MTTPRAEVTAALASLEARWGEAAPRRLGGRSGPGAAEPAPGEPRPGERTAGALALATLPAPASTPLPAIHPADRVIPTGFAELDLILGPGGLPRSASVALRGEGSSGQTTLALRVVAEAQATGSIVAWLDLARSFDPVEAVARGVRLEWLVVGTPETLDEALAIAGSLLVGRSVDLLVLDLPVTPLIGDRRSKPAGRLPRLAALARRAEAVLLVLEPPGLATGLSTAVAESTGLRLELARRSWIRLGRDVVGQRTDALVSHNRYGPPGRRATLRILYAEGGERDACLRRPDLLAEPPPPPVVDAPARLERNGPDHATPPSPLAAPSPRARPGARLRALPGRSDDPRGPTVGAGRGGRRGSPRPSTRGSPGDAARGGSPAGA